MKLHILTLFVLTFSILKADDNALAEKIKLLGSNEQSIRLNTKKEILKECYRYTYFLKLNLTNEDLEIQESCKEILSKFYNYQSEGMKGKLLKLETKENSNEQFNKLNKNWFYKIYLENYKKFGHQSPKWDDLAIKLFNDVLDVYTGKANNKKEVLIQAKKILDIGCQDPIVLYIFANMNHLLGNSKIALDYFILSKNGYETYKYDSLFKYFVFNKLILYQDNEEDKVLYIRKAIGELSSIFDQFNKPEDISFIGKIAFDLGDVIKNSYVGYKLKEADIVYPKNELDVFSFYLNYYFALSYQDTEKYLDTLNQKVETLMAKYPKIPEFPAMLCLVSEKNENRAEAREWFYKTQEIRPLFYNVQDILLDSLALGNDANPDMLLFAIECLGTYPSPEKYTPNDDKLNNSLWQMVCSNSHFQWYGWDLIFQDPFAYELIKYGFDQICKKKDMSEFLKSLKGMYAWKAYDFKTALAEIDNYKNATFYHKYQCYVSKEMVLSDIYPLIMIKDESLITFCSSFLKEPYLSKRGKLLLNCWQKYNSEKDHFYLSRLFHYLNFTEDGPTNIKIFDLMFEYGRHELIIKKFQDYKREVGDNPLEVSTLINKSYNEYFIKFIDFLQVNPIDLDELELIKNKIIELRKTITSKSDSRKIDAEANMAYLRVVHNYIIKNPGTKLPDYKRLFGYYDLDFKDFYEARNPVKKISQKFKSSFDQGALPLFGSFQFRDGLSGREEFAKMNNLELENETAVYTLAKNIYNNSYTYPFRCAIAIKFKNKGYKEIADYILMESCVHYQEEMCFNGDPSNYYNLNPLIAIKGLEDISCDLVELNMETNKNYGKNNSVFHVFCFINNRKYDLALKKMSGFTLNTTKSSTAPTYYYDSKNYKFLELIEKMKTQVTNEKEINESLRSEILNKLAQYEEVGKSFK
jgi:hypothetical protein